MPRIAVANELGWPIRRHYDLTIGVERFANEQGDWELEVGRYPETRMKRGAHFDGIVGRITPEILASARATGIRVVNTWINAPVAAEVPNVQVDAFAAGRMAAEHLYARGFRRLVHVGWQRRIDASRHWQGMVAAAQELGCETARLQVSTSFEETSRDWERFVNVIEEAAKGWQAPIGVATYGDDLGRALVTEIRELGWLVPAEVAVVSGHNDETYCNVYPSLSSIDMGYQQNGYEAARLLAALLRGEAPPVGITLVPPKGLVVRQTSDVFAVRDPRVARALRFMADNSHMSISVTEIARAAGVARQNLDGRFQREVGRTINNELIRLRIEQFKRLLVTSDGPLKEVARKAGFGSESQAYRTFKALTEMTPAQYRAKHGSAAGLR